jgi:two-component system, chemotaxis family, response regulator Rcp1
MSLATTRMPVDILLVEDDAQDAQLAREGLQEWGLPCGLTVVEDGVKALSYLRGEGEYAGSLLPDLILLDLKLPKKSGLEVLAEIKADETLRQIPVIVLTTSDAPDDIFDAYNLQASMYITKPSDLQEFERVMKSIHDLYLAVVKLPPRAERCLAADRAEYA